MARLLRLMLPAVLCSVATAAQANTYLVTRTTDAYDGVCDSDCSLREAVQAANAHHGADTIRLAAGTYTLTTPTTVPLDDNGQPIPHEDTIDEDDNRLGDLDVKDDLVITGPYGAGTAIDGGQFDRIIEIFPGVVFQAYNLTFIHGRNSTWGGAIYNAGTATLSNSSVIGNAASSGQNNNRGGGIANLGSLSLEHCQVSGNSTNDGESGFGLGGGIYNSGTLYLHRSTVSSNRVSDDDESGYGAGIYNEGSAVIEQSLFTANNSETNGSGAAIYNAGSLDLTNSTVSGNRAGEIFPGVVNNAGEGRLRLRFVTIADNNGGGLHNEGTVTLAGTIIAGNSSFATSDQEPDFHAGFNCSSSGSYSSTNSLLGLDGNCSAGLYVDNALAFTTLLEPLRVNGGVTATHKLLRGSVAVDAINPFSAANACERTDQRSALRPPVDDGRRGAYCDIGAYELRQ